MDHVPSDEAWLAANWPFVRGALPRPPARVLEIGCGTLGGHVPALRRDGYDAVGIDPEAPEEADYHRVEFERYEVGSPVDAVVASVSLHHVDDLGVVLDKVSKALVPDGTVVVIEMAWELFDEDTARWCFARLPSPPPEEHGWLQHKHDEWVASNRPWADYHRDWAEGEGLHTGEAQLRELDARFRRRSCTTGPFFFPDLAGTSEADEQAAIDAGQIRAYGLRYVATRA